MKHKGHDDEVRLSVNDSIVDKYLVRRDDNDSIPSKFLNQSNYWISMALGLSLPYRWYLYCTMGHIKVKIRRKVFGQGAQQDRNPLGHLEDFGLNTPHQPSKSQPTLYSASEYSEMKQNPYHASQQPLSYHGYHHPSESQPAPHSEPSLYQKGPHHGPSQYQQGQSSQPRNMSQFEDSSEPPDYDQACCTISEPSQCYVPWQLQNIRAESSV